MPTNRPVLTVQTSATKKTGKAGRRASGSMKSPSSATPSASALKHSAAASAKHTATATVPASATATSLNPLLTFVLHLRPVPLSHTFILRPLPRTFCLAPLSRRIALCTLHVYNYCYFIMMFDRIFYH
jgi:hypothetical protein